MLEQVRIYEGKLSGNFFLDYQLTDFNDNPVNFNYRGEAVVNSDTLTIFQTDCIWIDYKISKYATAESTEFSNGYQHGQGQQRKRWPGNKHSDKFISGWQAAWQAKKNNW